MKVLSIFNLNINQFILKNVLYLKLKKINTQFYYMNSQYLKSTKLCLLPVKNSYFNFYEKIVITNLEDYNFYDCNYYFGLFSGCHKFYFKILFKDYLSGLKPAKFSLALNQMGIKPDNFIELINLFLDEIISIDFFLNFLTDDEFNDDSINLFNLKLHFLVLLKKKKELEQNILLFLKVFFCFSYKLYYIIIFYLI
jgi:hypothetical protein